MILAFDTYYFDNKAKTACVAFSNWEEATPIHVFEETLKDIAPYVPGEFYKRELPCILSLLNQIDVPISTIIIDGFVFLDDNNKLGLGGHLYNAIKNTIPIIGVAKTNFATIEKNKAAILRGKSTKPLFITSIGIDKEMAAEHIGSMHGDFRLPSILKLVDFYSRE